MCQAASAECGALLDIGQDKTWDTLARAFSMEQPLDSENRCMPGLL